jgi:hypothetical protein
MFRLVGSLFRTIFLIKLMSLAFSAGMGAAFLVQLRQQYRSWGVVEGSDERGVRGDDLVAEPELVETRAIDIDAPPERVWPWLAQLGYGRGGWYSYPVLDRPWNPAGGPPFRSAEGVLSEYQDLAEGDLVPTHPQGGFEARIVEPDEALVLYLDDAMFREQMAELAEDVAGTVEEQDGEPDRDIELDMPPYQVSWAFELQALAGDRTRLIERLRVHIEASEQQWRARPALAMALFALVRSQLLGIKRRVEDEEAG